jgi:hypothetical protein
MRWIPTGNGWRAEFDPPLSIPPRSSFHFDFIVTVADEGEWKDVRIPFEPIPEPISWFQRLREWIWP